jgi:hypothetical protein
MKLTARKNIDFHRPGKEGNERGYAGGKIVGREDLQMVKNEERRRDFSGYWAPPDRVQSLNCLMISLIIRPIDEVERQTQLTDSRGRIYIQRNWNWGGSYSGLFGSVWEARLRGIMRVKRACPALSVGRESTETSSVWSGGFSHETALTCDRSAPETGPVTGPILTPSRIRDCGDASPSVAHPKYADKWT